MCYLESKQSVATLLLLLLLSQGLKISKCGCGNIIIYKIFLPIWNTVSLFTQLAYCQSSKLPPFKVLWPVCTMQA